MCPQPSDPRLQGKAYHCPVLEEPWDATVNPNSSERRSVTCRDAKPPPTSGVGAAHVQQHTYSAFVTVVDANERYRGVHPKCQPKQTHDSVCGWRRCAFPVALCNTMLSGQNYSNIVPKLFNHAAAHSHTDAALCRPTLTPSQSHSGGSKAGARWTCPCLPLEVMSRHAPTMCSTARVSQKLTTPPSTRIRVLQLPSAVSVLPT
mgnify:CR=1 FL=1